ncbi:MAG: hypothetical protein KJP05_09965 [Deltaproteobacteria bacterium]|nr:hypothetical protein [Deltaproteobacteria bacterium]
MAGKKLLNCLKKRDLLNSDKADKAELIKFGEYYLQDGHLSDSIDFFEKAQYLEGLSQLKERCSAEGDYFLYHRLAKILEESPSSEEWMHLGNKALDQGKMLFALLAYQQAERPKKVAEVEKLIKLPTKANDTIH